jgi:hypothetical protein
MPVAEWIRRRSSVCSASTQAGMRVLVIRNPLAACSVTRTRWPRYAQNAAPSARFQRGSLTSQDCTCKVCGQTLSISSRFRASATRLTLTHVAQHAIFHVSCSCTPAAKARASASQRPKKEGTIERQSNKCDRRTNEAQVLCGRWHSMPVCASALCSAPKPSQDCRCLLQRCRCRETPPTASSQLLHVRTIIQYRLSMHCSYVGRGGP